MVGVDQVRHHEGTAGEDATGVVRNSRSTLLIGDVGDGRVDLDRRAKINLCRVRCRTVDERDCHDAGIGRRGVD